MPDAQGIYKSLAFKKQTALGTPATGAGGQLLRRETATFNTAKSTYSGNEIATHQQHTGDKHGIKTINGSLSGLLSPLTYSSLLASLCRKDLAATSAITGLSLTIAGSGPYTLTRAAGDFLTGGVKIGDVVRITAGSVNANNLNKNLLVTGVTATVLTVLVLNETALTAEGPIASCTVTVTGKKTWVPTASHTNDYYTFEEWFSDLSRSHRYTDVQLGQADIAFPGTGNATVGLSFMGIGDSPTGSQVLTSPTAETTTEILAANNGMILVGGTRQTAITSISVSISGNMASGEAVIGSNTISDIVKGKVSVTGSFTAIFQSDTLAAIFDGETATSIIIAATENDDADADFVTIVLPRVKILSSDKDDGQKQIVRTYNFTAEINGSGGTSLANHQTTISIQDSNA
jgi:hypothetical protein